MPRCAGRTGVGGSFLSPPVSFLFLPSSQNSIEIVRKNFSPFSYHPFPLFLPHQQNSSSIPSNNFIIFRNETFVFATRSSIFASYTQHLTFQNRYKRSKSKTGSDREREKSLSPKTYFNVITISQLRPRHHRYQQDVRRRVKLTTAHVNEHRWTVYRQLDASLEASYRRSLIVVPGRKIGRGMRAALSRSSDTETFLYQTRFWRNARSGDEISGSYNALL